MVLMEIRRRMLMVEESDYVKNGLLYHFVSDDSDGQTWTDRISGLTFTLSGVSKTQDDGLLFDGHAFGYKQGFNFPKLVTAELVLSINTRGGIFFIDSQHVSADYQGRIRFDGIVFSAFYYTPQLGEKCVISGTAKNEEMSTASSIVYFNKTLLENGSNVGTYGRYYNGTSLGGRLTAQGQLRDQAFNGTLYQIRLYNRDLTEQELLYNQSIDIKKYGIVM